MPLVETEAPQSVEFTEEEGRYLANLHKGNSVSAQDAMNEIFEQLGKNMTRSSNDLELTGIIYKEELGTPVHENLLPDTLAYSFESKSQGQRYFVSADNRTRQSLLAMYDNTAKSEDFDYTSETIKDIIRKGIANCIYNDIINYELNKDSILNEIRNKIEKIGIDSVQVITRQQSLDPLDDNIMVNEYMIVNWHEVSFHDALVTVEWGQNEPYNWGVKDTIYCEYGSVPTGCVPTAVAQYLSYWKYPLLINGSLVNWDYLTETSLILPSNYEKGIQVASLLKSVFIGCETKPGCDGSDSNIDKIGNYLMSIGFVVSNPISYSIDAINSSLAYSRPVIITGKNSSQEGHAWIIDGNQIQEGTVRKEIYAYDKRKKKWYLYSSIDSDCYRSFYHYNWGAKGVYNGWFSESCFDYKKGKNSLTRNTNLSNFEYEVKLLTNLHPINE